ncbi:hypothetical protein [Halomicrobium salinisoli]|uniref:hypothetical protein n=1 Tax=Halomicrobium salinisoli TaxID=2878391 RepID=UPI001CF0A42A|nr:hypothetical protein [Halomicrobium salinisoli]
MTDANGARGTRTDSDRAGADSGDAATDGDGGYVHRPSGEPPSTGEREFDWRGWVLVATVVVAFLVIPVSLVALPTAQSFVESLGLSLRDAYLVLPLVPAFALGAVAVWSAVRARSG